MDIATIIGLVTAIGLVITAIQMGGSLESFVDVVSMLIVVGGTIGATLINYPLKEVLGAVAVGLKTFISKVHDPKSTIHEMIELSQVARKDGILGMEGKVDGLDNEFMKKAIQMAIDGQEPNIIDDILYGETEKISDRHALGGFSTAFGMIGTLVGLVLMLQNMEDPSNIGLSMSVALLTTFYGALMANILFLPMAGKLKTLSKKEVLVNEIIMAGVQSLAAGENPCIMERRLMGFLSSKDRTSSFD